MSPCLSLPFGQMSASSYRLFLASSSSSLLSRSHLRSYSSRSTSTSLAPPPAGSGPVSVTTPYFVSRNTRGSLPVYSDIRNGGTRYLVSIKNIRGNIHSLRDDLTSSLFPANSEQAARLKADITRPDTLVVTGGRWKHDITDWLRRKGF